jgi:L-ribulokinase
MSDPAGSDAYVVGVDFGTLSGRAVVVDARDGTELGSAVHAYPHGVIDHLLPATGAELPPQWALQDPEDWLEVLHVAVPRALAASGVAPEAVVGIGTDFTASTPLPVLVDGMPLCRVSGFEGQPHAYPKLWKHHAAQRHADRINDLAEARGEPWLARYGGRISSEWEFAKALQVLEEDPEIYERMERWIEGADWIIWQLGGAETRNICTAGYKGIHQDGHYPSEDFLRALDERFADFVAAKLEGPLWPLGARAGSLTREAAAWTGLPEGIAVAVGNVDAHVTAPTVGAVDPGQMVAIMGTSNCHIMNGDSLVEVPGMCGVVDGGIVPGLWGYEAGQSAVGDILGWFVDQCVPPHYHDEARARGLDLHAYLSELGARLQVGQHGLLALDWNGGNRSVLVDHELSGLIVGLTLATRAEDIYRALMEATAFGTRKILEAFADAGLAVGELYVAGGLVQNPVVMQIYADVTRLPLHVAGSEQAPALGSAMHAAVAAGVHEDIRAAAAAMGRVVRDAFVPDERRADAYDPLYEHYERVHDHFGRGGDDVMHRLRDLRPRELAHG